MESSRNERITSLYKRESARLQHVVQRQLRGDAVIAEDACAYAWATLVRRTDVDPDGPTVFGWLAQTAIHYSWDLAARETASVEGEQFEFVDAASAASVADLVEMREDAALIAQLPERQRQVMSLVSIGLSREEIADALGWTVRTVDRQIARARARLRNLRG